MKVGIRVMLPYIKEPQRLLAKPSGRGQILPHSSEDTSPTDPLLSDS